MRSLFVVIATSVFCVFVGPSVHAQSRAVGAEQLVLDDGAGHTVTIETPSPLSSSYIWTLPSSTPSASILNGTTNNSTLRWDNTSSQWVENTSVLSTAGGLLNVTAGYQIGGSTVLSDAGFQNLFVGAGSGASNTGSYNTATGYSALASNTSGSANTAMGAFALSQNTSSSPNSAFGYSALASNKGGANSAFGYNALLNNQVGADNAGFGQAALQNNTNAGFNTAVGVAALFSQSYSNGGVAWATYNVAVGYHALSANQPTSTSNGMENTAAGVGALLNNTTGYDNTAVGYDALASTNTTGFGLTAIGYNAGVSADGLTNATAIGYQASVGTNNTIQLGNSSVTLVNTSGGITAGGTVSIGGHVIATSNGTAAETGTGVTITDNPVFVITGTAGGTATSTLPGGTPATGDLIVVINDSNTTETIGASTIGAGASRTFYYNGTAWR